MKVFNKAVSSLRTEIEIGRGLKIQMENGNIFRLREDVEGHLEITKEDALDVDNLSLSVYPRHSNEITLN